MSEYYAYNFQVILGCIPNTLADLELSDYVSAVQSCQAKMSNTQHQSKNVPVCVHAAVPICDVGRPRESDGWRPVGRQLEANSQQS